MEILAYISVAIMAYLLGSIPTGFLAGKARGVDVRSLGSGNIGATNVIRLFGKKVGLIVLLADALKGYLACTLVVQFGILLSGSANSSLKEQQYLSIIGGIFAVLGHNYTCWLRFKGGKGIATSAGVLLAWMPFALLIVLGVWLAVFLLSKYVSLASITAALILPFAVWFTGRNLVLMLISAGLGALAIYKHKSNIQRLLSGTEHRFGSKKDSPAPLP